VKRSLPLLAARLCHALRLRFACQCSSSGITKLRQGLSTAEVQVGGPGHVIDFDFQGLPHSGCELSASRPSLCHGLSRRCGEYLGGRDASIFVSQGGLGSATCRRGRVWKLGSGIGLFAEAQPAFVLSASTQVRRLFGNAGSAAFLMALALGVSVH